MTTLVEVWTEAEVVRVSREGHEFWATFRSVNMNLLAVWHGMQDDEAAMYRVERRLIRFLDITAPAERNAEDVLPAAVALWMLAQEMGGLPELSEIPCLGPYDAAEGAIVCHDANSLRSRMSCWTSS